MNLKESRMMVLGARGMLGQVVCRHFRGKVREFIPFAGRFRWADAGSTVRLLAQQDPDIVINCAGAIKQRTSSDGELYHANSLLPLELGALLPPKTLLIHPSTDCVFSGRSESSYSSDRLADAEDAYGWSKYLGEEALLSRPLTLVPRVSIIGPDEREGGPGLLNWFLRQPDGASVKGFTNHLWNGITTLEWCHQIERRLRSGEDFTLTRGTRLQLGTEAPITKCDLLAAIAASFGKCVTIVPHAAESEVNRVLVPDAVCPPIEHQLAELAQWLRGSR